MSDPTRNIIIRSESSLELFWPSLTDLTPVGSDPNETPPVNKQCAPHRSNKKEDTIEEEKENSTINNDEIAVENLEESKQTFILEGNDHDLLIAAEAGKDIEIDKLLRIGVHVNCIDHWGRTALHLAVSTGNMRAIQLLLDAGTEVNFKDMLGLTPLAIALMRHPQLAIVQQLFDHGAELLPRTSATDTGLFLQFIMMCTPTIQEKRILHLLIEKGGLVNDPEAPGGRQALHFAAMSNNCVLIKELFDLGADITVVNNRNQTPKEVAVSFKCKEAAILLQKLEKKVRQQNAGQPTNAGDESGDG